MGELLTQKEAARYLGVSVRYLQQRAEVRRTLLPGHGPTRRPLIRYRRADLDAWVQAVNDPKRRIA